MFKQYTMQICSLYIANNQNKYGGGSLGTPSLTVKSADRNADRAFYECSATNAIGTGTSSGDVACIY
jgi:hypothetical protein